MGRLSGKTAIITGGGAGIGEATAKRFAEEGARVAIFERDQNSGQANADTINAAGGEALFVQVDVGSEEQIRGGVDQVMNRWGQIDILVNNAGITGAQKFAHEISVEEWDGIFQVNVRGTFLCSKHVLPHMMERKYGAIVNFCSIYGITGNDDIPSYHSTKGAVHAMTKTDAICYAKYGIRVNAVYPGPTMTALFWQAANSHPGGPDAFIAMYKEKSPLTLGEPVDVANCVLFLASDEARFVTGAGLICDGGFTAQ